MPYSFGADYYPEHWPPARWETDAALMERLGIDMVRLGEFSWHKMEPASGAFDFDWLEDAIAVLARHHIKTILGTPTAAPPAWLIRLHPEFLPVDSHGVRRAFGGRHHDCQSNPDYRRYTARLVTALAKRFGHHPDVIGWQVDNELGNSHGDLCFCESCQSAFQAWLQKKYGTVEALNRAWGTYFWSQEYDDFSQISAPKVTPNGHSPSLLLDWKRFCSDLIADFSARQVEILRRECEPRQFITHNCMGFADKVSYFDLGRQMDFLSHDQYPGGYFAQPPHQPEPRLAAELDFIRGCKDKTFWIMEQQTSITGWEHMGRCPTPGQIALWSMQSIAHGADAVVYFRWRSCLAGTEQYWHGILPHSGKPGRAYEELRGFFARVKPLMPRWRGLLPQAEVGIVYSYEQNYAFQIQPHNPGFSYLEQILAYYRGFYEKNVPVDFLSAGRDFSRYKLLLAPLWYLSEPETEEKLRAYVADGGVLVLTMRTGVKDAQNLCRPHTLPGALSDMLGLSVPEYDCLWGTSLKVRWGEEEYSAARWCDLLCPDGDTQVLACAASEWYAGTPVITAHRCGKGLAVYVGTQPDEALMAKLIEFLLTRCGVEGLGKTPPGVELARRRGEKEEFLFALNHTDAPQKISLSPDWRPCTESDSTALSPYGFAVFERG